MIHDMNRPNTEWPPRVERHNSRAVNYDPHYFHSAFNVVPSVTGPGSYARTWSHYCVAKCLKQRSDRLFWEIKWYVLKGIWSLSSCSPLGSKVWHINTHTHERTIDAYLCVPFVNHLTLNLYTSIVYNHQNYSTLSTHLLTSWSR